MAISVNDSQRFARYRVPFHVLNLNHFLIAQLRTLWVQYTRSSIDEQVAAFEGNLRNEALN